MKSDDAQARSSGAKEARTVSAAHVCERRQNGKSKRDLVNSAAHKCAGFTCAFVRRTAGYLRDSVKLDFAAKCQCEMRREVSVTDAPRVKTPTVPLIELVP